MFFFSRELLLGRRLAKNLFSIPENYVEGFNDNKLNEWVAMHCTIFALAMPAIP
jgi:hypothetical protein